MARMNSGSSCRGCHPGLFVISRTLPWLSSPARPAPRPARFRAPGGICQAGDMNPTTAQPHVVIVGGGIAGLAAAFSLRDEPVRVTVLEGAPRLGGKLSVSEVGGVPVDEGAEALLVTRPERTRLIAAV